MSVMTKDNRFKDAYSPDMEGGNVKMCEVLDKIENRGVDNAFSLVRFLMDNNRLDDLKKASEDESYRNRLMAEFFQEK